MSIVLTAGFSVELIFLELKQAQYLINPYIKPIY
ncbi:hypothetical protein L917_02902 [Phytophthora nicotianae]|uniref:Uncharacterized protein n=1 Tax=Phytophthora nicotianae TaxID=4792 RepID=W2NXT4_PHYNI|nr:hypothetical protein L917_02902 [Phytophthora nicotianae]ETM53562.1 hypothetical protein L914_02972 [Phytophthora nicotianae]